MSESTESKHTAGPWKAYGLTVAGERLRQVADCNSPAWVPGREEDAVVDEDVANARLIAAAPELLDVAETFLSMHADYQSDPDVMYPDKLLATVRHLAEAAVKKAKGG